MGQMGRGAKRALRLHRGIQERKKMHFMYGLPVRRAFPLVLVKILICFLSADARLGSEGVHGDGWDQGVERTRGGPTMADKRVTVFPAAKAGDIGEKERQFLASLDR